MLLGPLATGRVRLLVVIQAVDWPAKANICREVPYHRQCGLFRNLSWNHMESWNVGSG